MQRFQRVWNQLNVKFCVFWYTSCILDFFAITKTKKSKKGVSLFQCFNPTVGKDKNMMSKVNVADPDWSPDFIGVSQFESEFLTRISSLYIWSWNIFLELRKSLQRLKIILVKKILWSLPVFHQRNLRLNPEPDSQNGRKPITLFWICKTNETRFKIRDKVIKKTRREYFLKNQRFVKTHLPWLVWIRVSFARNPAISHFSNTVHYSAITSLLCCVGLLKYDWRHDCRKAASPKRMEETFMIRRYLFFCKNKAWFAQSTPVHLLIHKNRARICKPLKEHWNGFPAWRNRFLGLLKRLQIRALIHYPASPPTRQLNYIHKRPYW